MCPIVMSSKESLGMLKRFASKLSLGQVSGLKHTIIPRRPKSFEDLAQLCSIFSELDVFLWLQKKFPPGNVMEEQTALSRKEEAITIINQSLKRTEKLKLDHCYIRRDVRMRESWQETQSSESWEEQDEMNSEVDDADPGWNRGVEDV
jgi:Mitochondrial degradasome RNA helicase subunit C terminal